MLIELWQQLRDLLQSLLRRVFPGWDDFFIPFEDDAVVFADPVSPWT